MMNNAARRSMLGESSAGRGRISDTARPSADQESSAWPGPAEILSLVVDGSRFEVMLGEAASWADRMTLCVTAQQSHAGRPPWWGELLARSTKCDGIYLRRPEQTDGGLLHRLHDTGALRLLEGGGKQVAGNLLMFARGGELRVLLSHLSFERAVSGAAFGALLAFRGGSDGDFARSCRAQVESWARHSRIPSGSDIDALAFDTRRSPLLALTAPSAPWRVVSGAVELEARMRHFAAALSASAVELGGDALPADAGLADVVLESGDAVSVRAVHGGYRIELRQRGEARAPFVLTLHAGAAYAAGNALMLDAGDGRASLVWRGGLLGTSRSKDDLLWSEARMRTCLLEDGALGPAQTVAVVADTGAALAPQLEAFTRELRRLSESFEVAPPPILSDVLAEFASLSPRHQTLLLWRALLGLGPLDIGEATLGAARVLQKQGYLRSEGSESGGASLAAIAELLARAAESATAFDSPLAGTIRAIQPELGAYSEDDWLECWMRALPEGRVMARPTACRLAFEHARHFWGLRGQRLVRNGALDRLLTATLASVIRRGLLVRVGANGVRRLGPFGERPKPAPLPLAALHAPDEGFLGGWSRELERLPPVERLVLTRRAGWYHRRESQASVAERLGLSLERARQLEVEAWLQLERGSTWAVTLRARLEAAFAEDRAVPVRRLPDDDAWWHGVGDHLEVAEAVFENLLGGEIHCVGLGAGQSSERFFARFPQAELESALEGLLARAREVATPAAFEAYQALAVAAAEALDPGLSEYLLEALERRMVLDPGDSERVVGFAVGALTEPEPASPEASLVDSEERLRAEDTVRSIFRAAGTPLSSASVAERVRRRIDVADDALERLLAVAPFVRRNADQYGLLSRDVPGGHEAIATALNAVVALLEKAQRPLPLHEAFATVQARIKLAWSLELLCSLIDSDPALCLTPSAVTLRRWGPPKSFASSGLVCPGMPALARSAFEELVQGPQKAATELVQHVRAALQRLERGADAELAVSALARQLCHLYERLLEHVARGPVQHQRLAQAAIGHFLERVACDEDEELDAPHVDRERLMEARNVLAALLAHLELDWL